MKKTSIFHPFSKGLPRILLLLSLMGSFFFLASCEENKALVNNIDEREANEIIVFLSSKNIKAQKVKAEVAEGAGGTPQIMWNIMVEPNDMIEAMSTLNRQGLPRRKGTSLLELFAKQGLMTSDREETIRYQAGLEEQLKNTIRKIDGVLDVDVQISFPPAETSLIPGTAPPKVKASIYVKHQGILDDPNTHLESKIKRLVAGSIDNLDFEDVSVISDRSRISDIVLEPQSELISSRERDIDYVSIWNMVMTKSSAHRFRLIFFSFIMIIIALGATMGWMTYKFYPSIRTAREKAKEETKE